MNLFGYNKSYRVWTTVQNLHESQSIRVATLRRFTKTCFTSRPWYLIDAVELPSSEFGSNFSTN
jgi:hypothetical protein